MSVCVACCTIQNGASFYFNTSNPSVLQHVELHLSTRFTPAFPFVQNTLPPFLFCLHLTGSHFLLTVGCIVPAMGSWRGECFSGSSSLRATQLLHALIFLNFPSSICSVSAHFFFSFSLESPPIPSFLKSPGSSWCHSMHHHFSGAILYCCTVA